MMMTRTMSSDSCSELHHQHLPLEIIIGMHGHAVSHQSAYTPQGLCCGHMLCMVVLIARSQLYHWVVLSTRAARSCI